MHTRDLKRFAVKEINRFGTGVENNFEGQLYPGNSSDYFKFKFFLDD
jgi:hypothetical protein